MVFPVFLGCLSCRAPCGVVWLVFRSGARWWCFWGWFWGIPSFFSAGGLVVVHVGVALSGSVVVLVRVEFCCLPSGLVWVSAVPMSPIGVW